MSQSFHPASGISKVSSNQQDDQIAAMDSFHPASGISKVSRRDIKARAAELELFPSRKRD